MISRNGCYTKTPNIVLRAFEEWGHAYVFTPEDPEIYDLNATAWFIVELCDGRPFVQIEAAYIAELGERIGPQHAREQFHQGFDQLLARNIISASDM